MWLSIWRYIKCKTVILVQVELYSTLEKKRNSNIFLVSSNYLCVGVSMMWGCWTNISNSNSLIFIEILVWSTSDYLDKESYLLHPIIWTWNQSYLLTNFRAVFVWFPTRWRNIQSRRKTAVKYTNPNLTVSPYIRLIDFITRWLVALTLFSAGLRHNPGIFLFVPFLIMETIFDHNDYI